jgi:outer membrane protein TolC
MNERQGASMSKKLHVVSVIVGLLAICLLGSPLFTSGNAQEQQPGQSDKNAEIKKLLKERYDELTKAVDILTNQYGQGTVEFETLAHAQRDALKAGVDLADSPNKRIAAIRKLLEAETQAYDITERLFKAGRVTIIAVYQARAIVLEGRIELLREELKAMTPK